MPKLTKRCSTKVKKGLLPILIGGIVLFHLWLIFAAIHVSLPVAEQPLLFYSNQTRQDIKLTLIRALKGAKRSIYLSVYGICDPQIISTLKQKAEKEISVIVEYDASASLNLKKILLPHIQAQPIKTKGLMHRKIAVIDEETIFLGSANFTPTSLKHHANLVIGLNHPHLAAYLKNPFSNAFAFSIQSLQGKLFLLPDPSQKSLKELLQDLARAKKSIHIAMFTLTHPEITDALNAAKQRGVDVKVAIDYYTARGASKKAIEALHKAGVKIYLSQGQELLHHKWAIVDEELLIMGSANWTRAAFTKNQDFILFLSPLEKTHKAFFHNLWDLIETESVEL
jgi:phosphatidylserine/phosphatidylglycerophosphate/cardiolipin synthase-like enzyme